jgi:hypothetical protein
MSDKTRTEIRELYQSGCSVAELCRMAHRQAPEIYRAVADLQAARATGGKCGWCGCLGITLLNDAPDSCGRCSTCRRRPRRAALDVPRDRGKGKPRKLSDANVAAIRAARGHVRAHDVAEQFGISPDTVWMVWGGRGRFALPQSGGGVGGDTPRFPARLSRGRGQLHMMDSGRLPVDGAPSPMG